MPSATWVFSTPLHEVWSAADHGGDAGVAPYTCQTSIPYTSGTGENNIDTVLAVLSQTGSPQISVTYSSVNGYLLVSVANLAAGGAANKASWNLDITHRHTIVR